MPPTGVVVPFNHHDHGPRLAELQDVAVIRPEGVVPTSLTVDLTHACPFRCGGCIERVAMSGGSDRSLTTGTVLGLIETFTGWGGREILFYGGEPTFHPDFPAIVEAAVLHAARLRIITNGAFLGEPPVSRALRRAAAASDVRVRVSLNAGRAATHARLHRAAGYFERVVEGMASLTPDDSKVRLEVSFLLETANHDELPRAYEIATDVRATDFWVRPKSGLHGIRAVPLNASSRRRVREDLAMLAALGQQDPRRPRLHVERWHERYLADGTLPRTAKHYAGCFYCAAARLVVTPPDPGVVWACPYWRADERFRVADLRDVPFGSQAFERQRAETVRRIDPRRDCRGVICNRHEANAYLWSRAAAAEAMPGSAVPALSRARAPRTRVTTGSPVRCAGSGGRLAGQDRPGCGGDRCGATRCPMARKVV